MAAISEKMSIKELGDAIISFRNVSKAFSGNSIIKNLYLDVSTGKSLVIIGRSGAGKSVLLKCLLGLLEVDHGKIFFAGNRTKGLLIPGKGGVPEGIGVVFQSSALFDSIKIWENVAFLLKRKMSDRKAKNIAIHYLDAVGIPKRFADFYPCEISGGMQRRVAIARAIAARPKLLFFDEPTAGLDPIFASMISALIRHCVEELSATAITITHDIRCAEIIGDHAAMLYNGAIIWHGDASDIMRTKNPAVFQFVTGSIEGPISAFQQ